MAAIGRRISAFTLIASAPLLTSAMPLTRADDDAAAMLARLTPAALLASACGFMQEGEGAAAGKAATAMPLIAGLAPIDYPVTTKVKQAQLYFNQGLAFLYGFEFSKAERSFQAGRAVDPSCAMCLWGEALAIGPYINSDAVGVATVAKAHELTERALAMPGISARETALIVALKQRYAPKGPKNQKGVHAVTFANSMQAVSDRWPADDMIMVLAAEAAMNVRPWDYWEKDNQTPRPWARRAITLVERVLARNPDQTEAQHLYIHLTEASLTPGRAERAADMLKTAAPASAHLVHMPSHTYYRVGRFAESVKVNQEAIAVDEAMARRLNEDPKFYGYFGHHMHFILSAAEQVGDRATALRTADSLDAFLTPERVKGRSYMEGGVVTVLQVRAQFARGATEMLAIPQPDVSLPHARQMWWALRAEALGRDGKTDAALREIEAMRAARRGHAVGKDFQAAVHLAETIALARIAEGQGDRKGAIKLLRKAAAIEGRFSYNEPPEWHQPVDAALGALLLRSGDARGAKLAFDRALLRRPGSAWVLWGRAQAEAALGDAQASARTLVDYRRIWAGGADITLLKQI